MVLFEIVISNPFACLFPSNELQDLLNDAVGKIKSLHKGIKHTEKGYSLSSEPYLMPSVQSMKSYLEILALMDVHWFERFRKGNKPIYGRITALVEN